MSGLRLAGLGALLAVAAASLAEQPPNPAARVMPLVVYSSVESGDGLGALFERFTVETGIPITVVAGDAERHAQTLIEAADSPRADVFLSDNVQAIWRAAEEGALRPHGSDTVEAVVPAALRDTDGYWTALWQVDARLFVDRRALDEQAVDGFDYLADAAVEGRLCLTSSGHALNRAVIARLIDRHGRRAAELIVRGWVKNLARPPFASEAELVAALAAGECGIGIVSGAAGRPVVPGFVRQPLSAVTPVPRVGNAQTIGVSRHANSPVGATLLIDWLLSERVQADYPESRGYRPVVGTNTGSGDRPLGLAGRLDEEALKLAERARYR